MSKVRATVGTERCPWRDDARGTDRPAAGRSAAPDDGSGDDGEAEARAGGAGLGVGSRRSSSSMTSPGMSRSSQPTWMRSGA